MTNINLNQFLADHDKAFREVIGPTVNLRYSLGPNVPLIEAESGPLLELLTIFLSNAKKAMPNGGQLLVQTSQVALSEPESPVFSSPTNDCLMLAISDSGQGIHPETQTRIQQLFAGRWRPKGEYFSGLSHAKEILDTLQAKLLFYSQLFRGTTFKIYFPLHEADIKMPAPVSADRGTETLLFVEDDHLMRHIHTRFLRRRGYNVLEAEHGKEAIRLYEHHAPEIKLMITDVVMPELNGRQLVDLVSMQQPQLKVLYISGFTKDSIVQRGILKADMPFLEKPFGREELALRVRQLLDSPT